MRKKPPQRRRLVKVKTCAFTEQNVNYIDFLDVDVLKKFQTEGGRILSSRNSGTSKKYQQMLAKAIKRARNLNLIR